MTVIWILLGLLVALLVMSSILITHLEKMQGHEEGDER